MTFDLFNQPSSYFNTVPLEGDMLGEAENKTKLQDEIILEFFKANEGEFSPCQVWSILQQNHNFLLTSVRRSISNMTVTDKNPSGKLIKTGNRINGMHNSLVNTWKLA